MLKLIKSSYFIVFFIYTFSTVIFYAPYVVKNRFAVVERNWDGPAYIVIAKTFYNPQFINRENYIRKYLPEPKKFANKMPLYPILIRLFSFIGYTHAMIFISWFFGLFSLYAFFSLLKFVKAKNPLFLTLIFIFFPPRWFVLQKVGGVETLFVCLSLLSFFFFLKKKFIVSSIFLMLACLTKINAILILVSYFLVFIFIKREKFHNFFYFLLSPAAIILVFLYFSISYGDFFAFFRSDSRCFEYISLFKLPYGVFDASACYVGSIHLEEIFWFFGVSYLAIIDLIKTKKWVTLLFFLPSFAPMLFLAHNDFTRHGIILFFLFGIIFEKYLVKKHALIIYLLLLPAVYLYARNFVNVNIFIP